MKLKKLKKGLVSKKKRVAKIIKIVHNNKTMEEPTKVIEKQKYVENPNYVPKSNKKNYIEPKVFRDRILQYYEDEIFTDELSQGIYDIANRLAFSPNFINYTYREEMVGDAIIKMFQALKNKKFNKNIVNKNGQKGNPYSYYSKIAFNAFRNRIKKEKKNHETLLKYQESVYETLIDSGTIVDDQHIMETEEEPHKELTHNDIDEI